LTADKFTERLTRDNAAVLLVDHQVALYSGVRDIPVAELKHNVVGLAKAAQVLDVPLVVTTTAADGMWGPLIPELAEVLPDGLEVIGRSTVNAWDDERVPAATAMVEILADNADPLTGDLYAALDMPFATLVGQIAAAHA